MDSNAVSILADPARALARAGSRLAGAGVALLLPLLERITGSALREQVATFITGFAEVLGGITDRAREVETELRDEQTAFVHVLRPDRDSISAATTLEETLAETGLQVRHRIVNRITPRPGVEQLATAGAHTAHAPAGTAQAVAAMEAAIEELRGAEQAALSGLDIAIGEAGGCTRAPVSLVPALDHDIASSADLFSLGRSLVEV